MIFLCRIVWIQEVIVSVAEDKLGMMSDVSVQFMKSSLPHIILLLFLHFLIQDLVQHKSVWCDASPFNIVMPALR